jgi:Tfp pilus assembly protein PilO
LLDLEDRHQAVLQRHPAAHDIDNLVVQIDQAGIVAGLQLAEPAAATYPAMPFGLRPSTA